MKNLASLTVFNTILIVAYFLGALYTHLPSVQNMLHNYYSHIEKMIELIKSTEPSCLAISLKLGI